MKPLIGFMVLGILQPILVNCFCEESVDALYNRPWTLECVPDTTDRGKWFKGSDQLTPQKERNYTINSVSEDGSYECRGDRTVLCTHNVTLNSQVNLDCVGGCHKSVVKGESVSLGVSITYDPPTGKKPVLILGLYLDGAGNSIASKTIQNKALDSLTALLNTSGEYTVRATIIPFSVTTSVIYTVAVQATVPPPTPTTDSTTTGSTAVDSTVIISTPVMTSSASPTTITDTSSHNFPPEAAIGIVIALLVVVSVTGSLVVIVILALRRRRQTSKLPVLDLDVSPRTAGAPPPPLISPLDGKTPSGTSKELGTSFSLGQVATPSMATPTDNAGYIPQPVANGNGSHRRTFKPLPIGSPLEPATPTPGSTTQLLPRPFLGSSRSAFTETPPPSYNTAANEQPRMESHRTSVTGVSSSDFDDDIENVPYLKC